MSLYQLNRSVENCDGSTNLILDVQVVLDFSKFKLQVKKKKKKDKNTINFSHYVNYLE